MTSFTANSGKRYGPCSVSLFLPDSAGTPITAAPTIGEVVPTVIGMEIYNTPRFNLESKLGAGADRSIQAAFGALDASGRFPTWTDLSAPTTVTGIASTDDALVIEIDDIPKGCLWVALVVDGYLSRIFDVPPSVRKSLITTATAKRQFILASEGPGKESAATFSAWQQYGDPVPQKVIALPATAEADTHQVQFTKFDITFNGGKTTKITSNGMNQFTFVYAAPSTELLAFVSGGYVRDQQVLATFPDGLGTKTVTVPREFAIGARPGACNQMRAFDVELPGDETCQYRTVSGIFLANGIHAEDTLEVKYGDQEPANCSVTLAEANYQLLNGTNTFVLSDGDSTEVPNA